MGRRGYPAEFRRRVLGLVEAGRRVAEVAEDLVITEQTIYNWRRQDRIDRDLEAGLSTAKRGELAGARKRIRELETELAVHRRATELLTESADPKGDDPISTIVRWRSVGEMARPQRPIRSRAKLSPLPGADLDHAPR